MLKHIIFHDIKEHWAGLMLPDTGLLAMVNANCLLDYNVNETEHCVIYNYELHIYSLA